MANSQPHLIVFANEKGGTGKSTTAVHTAIALTALGHRVSMIDLDPRQRTVTRYLENRAETARRRGIELVAPSFTVLKGDSIDALESEAAAVSSSSALCASIGPSITSPIA